MRQAVIALATVWLLFAGEARADNLTLACLDVGRMVDACRASAQRFETATGHDVRVVAAGLDHPPLELYRQLFDIASPRLDVLQLADTWVPALAGDLATLPDEARGAGLPRIAGLGRDAGRLIALPQTMALTRLMADDAIGDPAAWADLRAALAAAPDIGTVGLDAGSTGPSLFPLLVDFVFAQGGSALDERRTLTAALTVLDEAFGADASDVTASRLDDPGSPFAADIAEAASGTGATDAPVLARTWFVAASRHSRSQDAATALVRHLASPEEGRRAALDFGLAPARPELYDEAEVVAVAPAFARIRDLLPRLVPPPVERFGTGLLDLADESAVAVRRMLRGEAEPDPTAEAILAAARRARQMVTQ